MVAGTGFGAELVVLGVGATIVVGHSEMGNTAASRIG
jgi:hypothetical protein